MPFFPAYMYFCSIVLLIPLVQGQILGPNLPQGTCQSYRDLAVSGTPVIPIRTVDQERPGFKALPGQVFTFGRTGGYGTGRLIKPGKTSWIPNCAADGSYTMLQKQVDNTQFCVTTDTGSIVLELNNTAAVPYFCDCVVDRQLKLDAHFLQVMMPDCDPQTGFYQPRQLLPGSGGDSGAVCMTPNGTRTTSNFNWTKFKCLPGGIQVPIPKSEQID